MDFGRQAGGRAAKQAAHMLLARSFYGQKLRMERGRYIGNLVGVASIHSFEYIHDELLDILNQCLFVQILHTCSPCCEIGCHQNKPWLRKTGRRRRDGGTWNPFKVTVRPRPAVMLSHFVSTITLFNGGGGRKKLRGNFPTL